MKRVLYIDFEDSFTYNVIQELHDLNLEVEVLNWKDFDTLTDHDLLVLGPGPGHPLDYQRIFPLVENWLQKGRAYFGVCLGHQIFWSIKGEEIIPSAHPVHGQKIKIEVDEYWGEFFGHKNELVVQRYNSLAVKLPASKLHGDFHFLDVEGEVMVSVGKNVITYQFHPESVGTCFRKSFFAPILRDLV